MSDQAPTAEDMARDLAQDLAGLEMIEAAGLVATGRRETARVMKAAIRRALHAESRLKEGEGLLKELAEMLDIRNREGLHAEAEAARLRGMVMVMTERVNRLTEAEARARELEGIRSHLHDVVIRDLEARVRELEADKAALAAKLASCDLCHGTGWQEGGWGDYREARPCPNGCRRGR